jgi:anion-transporting  ArsA/GET3 family ATPase
LRGANIGARALGATVGKIAGGELLQDTAEFLGAFDGMYEGFRQRAQHVLGLMGEDQTAFVVVTAPERPSLAEAAHFIDRLTDSDMNLAGVVVNRWREAPASVPPPAAAERLRASEDAADRAAAASLDVAERLRALERRGADAVAEFRATRDDVPITTVPELPLDIRDRIGVDLVARHLFEA